MNNCNKLPKYFVTACAKKIFINSETKRHLQAHNDVEEFLEEAISKVKIPNGALYLENAVNLGRIIGISSLVETNSIQLNEKTLFAKRAGRDWPSRIACDSKGVPCDSVTLETKFNKQSNQYELSTAYIGFPCPDEPVHSSDKTSNAFKKSLNFWCRHALVYDPSTMGKYFESTWESVLNK